MFEKKSFSVGALHGCTCRSLVYSHHPHRICWQKKTALDVGAQDTPAASSVPWSCTDKNKESIVFSHIDFKMLNPKICLEDIWRWMPYSMSPSLPVMQMGSVWRRFPQLHILWGFFLLLKHLRWTLWEGLCKQQVKPIAQEGVGVVSKTGLFSLESLLIMTASQTKSGPGDSSCPVSPSHCGKGWSVLVGLWGWRELAISNTVTPLTFLSELPDSGWIWVICHALRPSS